MNKVELTDGVDIFLGNATSILQHMPEREFQMCVTSPPYWGLRDYGVRGQIGAEPDLNTYIRKLVLAFRGIKRVLKDDGTLWLNIGDSYTSGDRKWRAPDKKNKGRAMDYRPPTPKGLKPKDLIGVPWRIAYALQKDGWYLREDIIWNKPNCQPESVKDRPTRSHEYLFLLSKNERYLYNSEAIKEPTADGQGLKNRRSVWDIMTNGFKGAHFAVFPPELVELCVLAGSNEGDKVIDPFLGTGTTAQVCIQTNRSCTGIELNKDYLQSVEERLRGS